MGSFVLSLWNSLLCGSVIFFIVLTGSALITFYLSPVVLLFLAMCVCHPSVGAAVLSR